jgi:hypothetical protein
MVPTFNLRIQAMIRAMSETILPALPDDQKLAQDQAKILLGNLNVMAEQCDHLYDYELAELSAYAKLVRDLVDAAKGGMKVQEGVAAANSLLGAAEPMVRLSIPHQNELSVLVKQLKAAADQLVQAAAVDGAVEFRSAAQSLVVAQSAPMIMLERRWSAKAGFDIALEKLPSLDGLLAR